MTYEEALRRADELEHGLADKVRKAHAMREAAERVTVTASSASGAFAVTVDQAGRVVDVVATDAVRKLPVDRVGPAVLEAIRLAQSGLGERLRAELGPGDPDVARLAERYERQFPRGTAAAEVPQRRLRIGEIED
jgi:hypothetical protein